MKKIFLSLFMLVLMNLSAQITGGFDQNNAVSVFKSDLIGFNAGQGYLEKPFDVTTAQVNQLYQQQIVPNIGNKIMYRMPAGEAGMYYNFWYAGWGSVGGVFRNNMSGYPTSNATRDGIYSQYYNYSNLNPTTTYQVSSGSTNYKGNILFPYINIATNNNNSVAYANFVVNILEHYRDFRSTVANCSGPIGGSINSLAALNGVINPSGYFPRKDVFDNVSIIAGIQTYQGLLAAPLSDHFKDIVKQNLDAFTTIVRNNVKVYHVEMGNELANQPGNITKGTRLTDNYSCTGSTPNPLYTQFTDKEYVFNIFNWKISSDQQLWYRVYNGACANQNHTYTQNSITAYLTLCQLYVKLIKERLQESYDQTQNPIYLDMKNNIKFGVPFGFNALGNSGTNAWSQYLYNNMANYGINAVVIHPYSTYSGTALSTGCTSTDLDNNFNLLKTSYVNRFNTLFKTSLPNELATTRANVNNIWVTEWEIGDGVEGTMKNTLLHGMVYMDEIVNYIDLNANLNLTVPSFTKKDIIKLANHQILWSGDQVNTSLFTLNYNTTTNGLNYRTLYYANKLLLPIMKENVQVINLNNGGINENINDLYFRSFYEYTSAVSGQHCGIKTFYVYFNNKSGSDYTLDATGFIAVPSNHTLSITRSQIYANKLSASRGRTDFNRNGTIDCMDNTDVIYDGTNGNAIDLNKTVQVEDAVPVDNQNMNSLMVRKYSAGYYKFVIIDHGPSGNGCGGGGSTGRFVKDPTLFAVYPNPTNTTVNFDIKLPTSQNPVVLNISDNLGRIVKTIVYKPESGIISTNISDCNTP